MYDELRRFFWPPSIAGQTEVEATFERALESQLEELIKRHGLSPHEFMASLTGCPEAAWGDEPFFLEDVARISSHFGFRPVLTFEPIAARRR